MFNYSIKQVLQTFPIALLLLAGCTERQSTNPISQFPSQAEIAPTASISPQTPSPSVQSSAAAVDQTRQVNLANNRVSFVLPPGFTAMTSEEIALKFPSRGGNRPQYVYANERRNVSIAITFSNSRVTPRQLPELKAVLQKSLKRMMPEIEWLTEEITTINSNPWAHLEFISRAIDTQVHNDTYFTSFDGKMLGFNFNSTVKQYDAVKSELRNTRDSIVLKP